MRTNYSYSSFLTKRGLGFSYASSSWIWCWVWRWYRFFFGRWLRSGSSPEGSSMFSVPDLFSKSSSLKLPSSPSEGGFVIMSSKWWWLSNMFVWNILWREPVVPKLSMKKFCTVSDTLSSSTTSLDMAVVSANKVCQRERERE